VGQPDRRWPERLKVQSSSTRYSLQDPALARQPGAQNTPRRFLAISSIGAVALPRPSPFVIDHRKPQSISLPQGTHDALEASRPPSASRSPLPLTASRILRV